MFHKPTERVLSIFNLLSGHPQGLTLTQISQQLAIPKSTISPILQEMVFQNYLYLNNNSGRYFLGISLHAIASSYDITNELSPQVRRIMQRITQETNEMCQLGILEGSEILYLVKEVPTEESPIQIISYTGKKLPAYATALGKALLSSYTREELEALYPEGLTAITPNTITDFDRLWEQLQEIKTTDIAYESEEVTPFLCCYATPIVLTTDQSIALSISLPLFRTNDEKIAQIKEVLLHAKEEIENLHLLKIGN